MSTLYWKVSVIGDKLSLKVNCLTSAKFVVIYRNGAQLGHYPPICYFSEYFYFGLDVVSLRLLQPKIGNNDDRHKRLFVAKYNDEYQDITMDTYIQLLQVRPHVTCIQPWT